MRRIKQEVLHINKKNTFSKQKRKEKELAKRLNSIMGRWKKTK